MAWADDLRVVRTQVIARLTEITANPQPNYQSPDGKSVSWGDLFDSYMRQLKGLNDLLGETDPEGPWEFRSVGV